MMAKVTGFASICKRAQTVQLLAINLKKCKAKEKTFVKKTQHFILLCGLRFSMNFTLLSNRLLAFRYSKLNLKATNSRLIYQKQCFYIASVQNAAIKHF